MEEYIRKGAKSWCLGSFRHAESVNSTALHNSTQGPLHCNDTCTLVGALSPASLTACHSRNRGLQGVAISRSNIQLRKEEPKLSKSSTTPSTWTSSNKLKI